MENIFSQWLPYIVVLAIAATAGVLIYGLMQMAKSTPRGQVGIDKARRSNKLMQYRILLQLIAIGIMMLVLALR